MVQFKVRRGHISFQALKGKHQLRKNEESPVLSYFPSVVIRSPRRLPTQSRAWRKEAITQRSQAKRKGQRKIVRQGRGPGLHAGMDTAFNIPCFAQKLELRPWTLGSDRSRYENEFSYLLYGGSRQDLTAL